jgi:hypothetical protein
MFLTGRYRTALVSLGALQRKALVLEQFLGKEAESIVRFTACPRRYAFQRGSSCVTHRKAV